METESAKNTTYSALIFDPHLSLSYTENNIAYNGLYNILLTIGFNNVKDIYNFIILIE